MLFCILHVLNYRSAATVIEMAAIGPLVWMAVQVFAGSVASMAMGFLWFSESAFGRPWWRYQFRNRSFGDMKDMDQSCNPLLTSFLAMAVQSCLLLALNNASRKLFCPEGPSFFVPIICIAFLVIIVACNNVPHYAYTMKPLPLFCICSGFDTVQMTACYLAIYFLGTVA